MNRKIAQLAFIHFGMHTRHANRRPDIGMQTLFASVRARDAGLWEAFLPFLSLSEWGHVEARKA